MDDALPQNGEAAIPARDYRMYVPEHGLWKAQVKTSWDSDYCYAKNPGEDYHHLLQSGEIFLQRSDEKYCLNCAVRMGLISFNRLYWQKGGGT